MYAIGIICVQFRSEKPMGYIAITFQWICLYGIKPIITSMNFACHGHKQLSIEMTCDYQMMEHWLKVLAPTTWNWRVRISNLKHCIQIMSKFNSHLDKRLDCSNMLFWLQMHVHFKIIYIFHLIRSKQGHQFPKCDSIAIHPTRWLAITNTCWLIDVVEEMWLLNLSQVMNPND